MIKSIGVIEDVRENYDIRKLDELIAIDDSGIFFIRGKIEFFSNTNEEEKEEGLTKVMIQNTESFSIQTIDEPTGVTHRRNGEIKIVNNRRTCTFSKWVCSEEYSERVGYTGVLTQDVDNNKYVHIGEGNSYKDTENNSLFGIMKKHVKKQHDKEITSWTAVERYNDAADKEAIKQMVPSYELDKLIDTEGNVIMLSHASGKGRIFWIIQRLEVYNQALTAWYFEATFDGNEHNRRALMYYHTGSGSNYPIFWIGYHDCPRIYIEGWRRARSEIMVTHDNMRHGFKGELLIQDDLNWKWVYNGPKTRGVQISNRNVSEIAGRIWPSYNEGFHSPAGMGYVVATSANTNLQLNAQYVLWR